MTRCTSAPIGPGVRIACRKHDRQSFAHIALSAHLMPARGVSASRAAAAASACCLGLLGLFHIPLPAGIDMQQVPRCCYCHPTAHRHPATHHSYSQAEIAA